MVYRKTTGSLMTSEQVNPSMLTAAKSSLTMLAKSCRQKHNYLSFIISLQIHFLLLEYVIKGNHFSVVFSRARPRSWLYWCPVLRGSVDHISSGHKSGWAEKCPVRRQAVTWLGRTIYDHLFAGYMLLEHGRQNRHRATERKLGQWRCARKINLTWLW